MFGRSPHDHPTRRRPAASPSPDRPTRPPSRRPPGGHRDGPARTDPPGTPPGPAPPDQAAHTAAAAGPGTTGSTRGPFEMNDSVRGNSPGPNAARIPGNRPNNARNAISASNRANGAPRQ